MPTDTLVEGKSERREGRCPLTHWWVQWGGEIREEGGKVPTDSLVEGRSERREGRCPLTHWWRGDQRGGREGAH